MTRLINHKTYAADFYSPKVFNENQSRVVVTFNFYGQKTKEGLGWGGQYFLDLGFSILAIKTLENDWYQNLSINDISELGKHLNHCGYLDIATYGTSMGGYAAIVFASSLGAKTALAFSPQFSIWEDWDKRWGYESNKITRVHDTKALMSPQVQYCFVYDPFDGDIKHVNKFKECGNFSISEIKTPFYGHPCVKILSEAGIIGELNQQIINGGEVKNYNHRNIRRECFSYYENIAERLFIKGKYKLALDYLNYNLSGPRKFFSASKMRLECILRLTPELFLPELMNALNYAKEDGNFAPNYLNIINANFQLILGRRVPEHTKKANLKLLILLIKIYGSDVASQQEIIALIKHIDGYLND